jgi:hypothetical protein
MRSRLGALSAIAFAAAALSAWPVDARTTTSRLKACNEEWKAMKANNTVGDKKYADFRKECLARPASETTAAPGATTASPTTGTTQTPPPASQPPAARLPASPRAAAGGATAPAAEGQAVFPTAVSPKYANESAGVARRHTCLDQYHANKAGGGSGNAGLSWIQKGGGYYSECNKRLKG